MENRPLPNAEIHELARASLSWTARILEKFTYRIAGSANCLQTAHEIADRLKESCDGVDEEAFTLHPKALWYLGRVLAVIYCLSTACAIAGRILVFVGAAACLAGLVYGATHYVFYAPLFDRMFKRADGLNVAGTLEPTGIVERQVLLVGHHDSPYIFSFLERMQEIAFARFLLGILSYVWLTVYTAWLALRQASSTTPRSAAGAGLWITVVGLFFAVQLFFMMSARRSPGAGDNLNSTSMAMEIAAHFRRERDRGHALERTRLIALSTDGEEIGQRGAVAYVRRHHAELISKPTSVLNIDSVYRYKDLAILTRDRNSTCRLSTEMAADLCALAAMQGTKLRRIPIPFGGGGTDAAAFSTAGIRATTIIAQPTGFANNDHLYHTSKDTVANIELRAVEATIGLAIAYLRKMDSIR